MRALIIILLSLPSMALAQMLVDQVDGDTALLCSDDVGEWVCKPVDVDIIRQLGFTDIEGMILIDEETTLDKEGNEFLDLHRDGC